MVAGSTCGRGEGGWGSVGLLTFGVVQNRESPDLRFPKLAALLLTCGKFQAKDTGSAVNPPR